MRQHKVPRSAASGVLPGLAVNTPKASRGFLNSRSSCPLAKLHTVLAGQAASKEDGGGMT